MNPFTRSLFDPTYYTCDLENKTYVFRKYHLSSDIDHNENTVLQEEIPWFIPDMFHQSILNCRLSQRITSIRHAYN